MSTTQQSASSAAVLDALTLDEIVDAAIVERDRRGLTITGLVINKTLFGEVFGPGSPAYHRNLRFLYSSASNVPRDSVRIKFAPGQRAMAQNITIRWQSPAVRSGPIYKYDEEVGF